MITEAQIGGNRVLTRRLMVAAVEDATAGDWAAYYVDEAEWRGNGNWGNTNQTLEHYAATEGTKLSEEEAYRYFRGQQCPRGPYRA